MKSEIKTTDKIASTLLGKRVKGLTEYDPSILVAIPRSENRNDYGLNSKKLCFDGWDVWHCYEFSVLTVNKLPVTRVLKLKYSAQSPYLVESKSLKLYLNAFNMFSVGKNAKECLQECKKIIESDLSSILKADVLVSFLDVNVPQKTIFSEYSNVLSFCNEDEIEITEFKESPELLQIVENQEEKEYKLYFDSLRSNCRVTHQPDFGDVFIYYRSKYSFEPSSLIKYLVSFREEYHFHEECCEMIYKRLYDKLNKNDKLMVCALYTRRGGIDISPVRYSKNFADSEIDKLTDLSVLARFGVKQ